MSKLERFLNSFSAVVITGGSSGIGKCFIETIRNVNISLPVCNISRTEASFFSSDSQLHHFGCDLTDADKLDAVLDEIQALLRKLPKGPILLINNAGFGSYGEFSHLNPARELSMIDTNIRAVVQITGKFLPLLQEEKGAILNVASTAAWQPTPYMATYGATKSFLLNWSLALSAELKDQSVQVLALCPGPTESQFFKRAGFSEPPIAGFGESAQTVVSNAFAGMLKKRTIVVSGWSNRVLVAFSSRLPRSWQAPLTRLVLKKMRLDKMK